MKKPKAIIFDFDGTIVSTELLHYRALEQALSEEKIVLDYQEFAENYFGVPDARLLPIVFEKHGRELSKELAASILQRKKNLFLQLDIAQAGVYPGVLEFMLAVSDYYPMAICTGAHRQDIELVLPTLADGLIYPLMKHIVTADDVTHSKPLPDSYLLVAEYLQVKPEECLVFEDTPTGIKAAKAAGMYVVALTQTNPAEKLQQADEVRDSIFGYEDRLLED